MCLCVCLSNPCCPAHLVGSRDTASRLISRNWHGITPPVDATMVGRVFLGPKPTPPPPTRRRSNRRRKPSRKRSQRRRQSRFLYDDFWGYDDLFDMFDIDYYTDKTETQQHQNTPIQNVYFFKKGMKNAPI